MRMPLVDVSLEMGTMTFASGSHKGRSLTDLVISDKSEERYQHVIAEREFSLSDTPAMRAPATRRFTPAGRCTARPATTATRPER